jgi:hypothetical protein
MSNEKLTMKAKNHSMNPNRACSAKVPLLLFGIALVCALLSAACDNPLKPPELHTPTENGYGKISVSFAEDEAAPQTARTVMPSILFDKYVYTFTKTGGATGTEIAPDNNGLFSLEVGNYKVKVEAYIAATDTSPAASGESVVFSVLSGINEPVRVPLSPVAAGGEGTFSYTITYPANASAKITLEKWLGTGISNITLNPADITGGGITETFQLDVGSCLLTVLVTKNELYAGTIEAVHIKPSLATVFKKDFDDSDLLVPYTPTADDFEIGNLQQMEGSFTAVTITPWPGKLSGAITIYYEGTGGTTYAKSTAVPTAAGMYAVTFDVTGSASWNAAMGLSAGMLCIYDAIFTSVAN